MGGRRGGRREEDVDWMGGQPSPLCICRSKKINLYIKT